MDLGICILARSASVDLVRREEPVDMASLARMVRGLFAD
jgi:hypothetical protein